MNSPSTSTPARDGNLLILQAAIGEAEIDLAGPVAPELTAKRRLKADLRAMTIDRDLWQEEHAGDCPCACQLEALQAEISSSEPPQSIANRYYLLGLHYTGPKYPEPCAPPYQPMEMK